MNAAISGTKGFALIVDGKALDAIDLHGHRRSAHATHVRRMLDEPGDTRYVECHDLAEVQRRLHEAADAADGAGPIGCSWKRLRLPYLERRRASSRWAAAHALRLPCAWHRDRFSDSVSEREALSLCACRP